jgi:hypothetical protein
VAGPPAAVLASRPPRHPVGWLLLTLGAALAASGAVTGYANYGLLAVVTDTMQPHPGVPLAAPAGVGPPSRDPRSW